MADWTFKDVKLCIEKCEEMEKKVPVYLTKEVVRKIKSLLKAYPSLEWIAGLKGEFKPVEGWTITEIMLAEQTVSGAFCKFTDSGAAELAKHNIVGYIHSHNTMTAFHSATDVENDGMCQVGITVNNAFDTDIKCKVKLPCGKFALLEGVLYLDAEEQDTGIIEQAKVLIKEEPKTYLYNDTKSVQTTITGIKNAAFCPVCENNVGKKSVVCPFCDARVHQKCMTEREGYMLCKKCDEELKDEKLSDYYWNDKDKTEAPEGWSLGY